jgi:hypothetical protein
MSPQINDVAPDFEAQTPEGRIRFHDWIGRHEVELMALDDRMLRDIGQSRSEVACAVRRDRPFDRADDRRLP